MALRAYSFARLASADLSKLFNSVTGAGATVVAGAGRGGRAALQLVNSTVSQTMSAQASWALSFGFQVSAFPGAGSNTHIARLTDAGSTQLVLQLLPDGTLRLQRDTTTIATSTFAININTEYHFEWYSVIDNNGSSELRINGTNRLSVTATDTQATANASANAFVLAGTVSGLTQTYSDVVVRNGADAAGFWGDVITECIFPNAAGNYAQWTPSAGATQYEVIDDATPSMADYLSESTAGERTSVGMTNLTTASGVVKFVNQLVYADKDEGGTRQIELFTRVGGTDYDSGVVESISGDVYYSHSWATNPATAAAWTISETNAFEGGVELVA